MKVNVGKIIVDNSTSYEAIKACYDELAIIGNTLNTAVEKQNWGEVGRATEKLDTVYKTVKALQEKMKPRTLS